MVRVRHRSGLGVVTAVGELDLVSAPALSSVLDDPASWAREALVLDLSELGFIDSTGLRVLEEAQRRASARSARLVLAVGRTAFVGRVLTLTGLWPLFTSAESLEEAVALAGRS